MRKKKKEESNTGSSEGTEMDNHAVSTEIPCQLPGPEQLLINRQETILLRKIVQGLKPNYKAIIELHYFKELSCEEIAQQLKLPESTVKVRLFRARELLYNILMKK